MVKAKPDIFSAEHILLLLLEVLLLQYMMSKDVLLVSPCRDTKTRHVGRGHIIWTNKLTIIIKKSTSRSSDHSFIVNYKKEINITRAPNAHFNHN